MSVVVIFSSIILYITAILFAVWFVIKREPMPDMSFAPIKWQRDINNAERVYIHKMLRTAILAFVLASAQLFLLAIR